MTDPADRATAAGILLEKLSFPRVVLASFAGVCAVGVMAFYESRTSVFASVINSPPALLSVGIGIAMIIVAGIAHAFVSALERRTDTHIAELRDRIAAQEDEIKALREDNRELAKQLAEAWKDCDARLAAILKSVNHGGN